MRRRFRYNPATGEMDEIPLDSRPQHRDSAMIMPDIPDFVSPIDGSVVHGRRSLREHNKAHNVTNVADFKQTWERQAAERAKAYVPGSGYDSQRRKEHIIRSIEQLRRR